MKKFICTFTLAMSVFLLAACVSEADVEAARNEGYKAGYADCKDEYTNATQKAYSSGYDWGYRKGYDAGYEDGKEEAGTSKTKTVYVTPDDDELYDEIYERAYADAEEQLIDKYDINFDY